jgi:hypothetical protein
MPHSHALKFLDSSMKYFFAKNKSKLKFLSKFIPYFIMHNYNH